MGVFDTINVTPFGDQLAAREQQQFQNQMAEQQLGVQQQALQQRMQAGSVDPAAVREHQYFEGLSPEQQQQYLSVKRAKQIADLGGSFARIDPLTNEAVPIIGGEKGLTPAQDPFYLQEKAEITARNQPATAAQADAAGFADRMSSSNQVISQLGEVGTDLGQVNLSKTPGGNFLVSDEYQSFDQAKRDFLNAVLRQESGAAIGKEEFASADLQYFPQPGDSPRTLQQKAQNRALAIKGVGRGAGYGYEAPAATSFEGGKQEFDNNKKRQRLEELRAKAGR
jgi:hypothetical protein